MGGEVIGKLHRSEKQGEDLNRGEGGRMRDRCSTSEQSVKEATEQRQEVERRTQK